MSSGEPHSLIEQILGCQIESKLKGMQISEILVDVEMARDLTYDLWEGDGSMEKTADMSG